MKDKLLNEIKQDVITEISRITSNDFEKYKLNTEFIQHVASLVLNALKDKKLKVDLLVDVVLDILTRVHKLTEAEKQQVKTQLEFLQTNKLLQDIPYSKQLLNSVKNYFFKSGL
jgi:hypothetical protein